MSDEFVALPSVISQEKLMVMVDLAEAAPQGAFAEVGVYQGGSASILYAIAQRDRRALYLYDTFEGIPFSDPAHGDAHLVGDFSDCSMAAVQSALPDAIIEKGVFPDCRLPTEPVAFVHADADQYQSTRAVCQYFPPLMTHGGMILFDDYYALDGCRRAVDEFLPQREILPDGRALVRF